MRLRAHSICSQGIEDSVLGLYTKESVAGGSFSAKKVPAVGVIVDREGENAGVNAGVSTTYSLV